MRYMVNVIHNDEARARTYGMLTPLVKRPGSRVPFASRNQAASMDLMKF